MDANLRDIVARIASHMSRSHAALRKDYDSGITQPLIDRIRSGLPLEQSEREYIALLLSGDMGRRQHVRRAVFPNGQKRRVFEEVRQTREATMAGDLRSELSEIYVDVANSWTSDPKNGQCVAPTQVEQIYRKSRSEIRKVVKTK